MQPEDPLSYKTTFSEGMREYLQNPNKLLNPDVIRIVKKKCDTEAPSPNLATIAWLYAITIPVEDDANRIYFDQYRLMMPVEHPMLFFKSNFLKAHEAFNMIVQSIDVYVRMYLQRKTTAGNEYMISLQTNPDAVLEEVLRLALKKQVHDFQVEQDKVVRSELKKQGPEMFKVMPSFVFEYFEDTKTHHPGIFVSGEGKKLAEVYPNGITV